MLTKHCNMYLEAFLLVVNESLWDTCDKNFAMKLIWIFLVMRCCSKGVSLKI